MSTHRSNLTVVTAWQTDVITTASECQAVLSIIYSQVQTTLAVVEEERDRFMSKLLNEEKTRKALEGALLCFFFF